MYLFMCVCVGTSCEVEWTLELVAITDDHRFIFLTFHTHPEAPLFLGMQCPPCVGGMCCGCAESAGMNVTLHASCRAMLRTVNSASLAHCFQAVELLSGYTFHPIWNPVVRVCVLGWVPSILFYVLSFLCSQHGQHRTFCTA